MSVSLFILVCLLCFYLRFIWRKRKWFLTSSKLKGPLNFPFLGSAHLFLFCKTTDLLQKIYQLVEQYDSIFRFWLGPHLIIVFKKPEHLEKILSSTKFSHKHDMYKLLKGFLGDGLITASGPRYRMQKKLIQPLFSQNFSSECGPIFTKHIEVCIEHLEKFQNQEVDIGRFIHNCAADIIGETVLGFDFQAQNGKNLEYVEAFTDVYRVVFARLVRPWLHPELIFNISSFGQRYKEICNLAESLMKDLAAKAEKSTSFETIIGRMTKCKNSFTKEEFLSQLITLYMASQDTIALIVSAACLCFGMYPEYQQKAIEEINEVFGMDSENLSVKEIYKLQYLDMCLKDIFRIFPIAPYIFRKALEDEEIAHVTIPKGCGIGIPIYNLHKDPQFWENPDHFHPDHFLPEFEKIRPKCSYIPFSGGPRSCIGKTFANIGIKIMLVKLLQKYEFQAKGKLPDVKLTMDISIRAERGYKVKIKKRVCIASKMYY